MVYSRGRLPPRERILQDDLEWQGTLLWTRSLAFSYHHGDLGTIPGKIGHGNHGNGVSVLRDVPAAFAVMTILTWSWILTLPPVAARGRWLMGCHPQPSRWDHPIYLLVTPTTTTTTTTTTITNANDRQPNATRPPPHTHTHQRLQIRPRTEDQMKHSN